MKKGKKVPRPDSHFHYPRGRKTLKDRYRISKIAGRGGARSGAGRHALKNVKRVKVNLRPQDVEAVGIIHQSFHDNKKQKFTRVIRAALFSVASALKPGWKPRGSKPDDAPGQMKLFQG